MVIWAILVVLSILALVGAIPVAALAWSVIIAFGIVILAALLD